MLTSDKGRPALHLRRNVDNWRTLQEDRKHHLEAHGAFCKFIDRIEDAKWIEATYRPRKFGSPEVLKLRRCLFRAQIADAEREVTDLALCDDAWVAWTSCGHAVENIGDAIAEYLDDQVTVDWKIEDVLRLAGREV
jgi:hypothetical protein